MEETPRNEREINHNPPIEETSPEKIPTKKPEQATETNKAKSKDRKKGLIPTIAVCLILIIGIAVWYLTKPKDNQSNNQNSGTSQTDKKNSKEKDSTGSETTTENKKVESKEAELSVEVDESGLSPLFRKLLILHSPRLKNYLSYATQNGNPYADNQYFFFSDRYEITEGLYTIGLTNSDKFYIVTQYMADYKLLKPLSSYNVPEDFLMTRSEYCGKDAQNCPIEYYTAASEEEVAKVYYEFFGENPTTFETPTKICGSCIYDSEYHLYYSQTPGCGGYDGPPHHAYIEKYTETDDSAFVYVRVATIYEHTTNPPVFKDFLKESELDTAPNELVYTHLESSATPLPKVITAENYTEFQQYRFVFKKDGENYYFRTIEKL